MRRTVLLVVAMAAAVLLAGGLTVTFSGLGLAQSTSPERTTPDSSQTHSGGKGADHRQEGHYHEQGPKATKSGIFAYRTGGETPSGHHEHEVEYFIIDEHGKETKLQLADEAVLHEALKDLGVSKEQLNDGGPQPLVGKQVTIEGRWTSHDVEGERGSDESKIKVEKIQNERSDTEKSKFDFEADPAVTGSKPAVTIACKFSGNTVEPKTTSYFNSLVSGTTKPGIDHFWRETSYNQINLSGSQVVGWYTLPKTRTQYLNSDGSANLGLLAQDCTAAADSSVFYPNYSTINLMFNDEMDGSAWGGFQPMTLDGQTITYGMTWMPPWGYGNVGILGHEMGHSYGLPHSSGPYGQTYDSWWDVMSSGGLIGYNSIGRTDCFRDATYGCMAMHTISAHKDKLGWIPSGQKYTAASGSQQTVTIDRLGTATSASGNYLMALIPINGSTTQFYTVEARRPVGYDAHAATDGLVIHKIDTSQAVGLTRFAYVVDSDNNGNPNDAGAAWVPGETFTDSANSISVQVTGSTTSGYTVRIQNGGSTAPVNDNFANAQGLTGTTATGSNVGATKETGEPNHAGDAGGKSVWYRWTPQTSGTAVIDTAGSNFDTLLAVYTGGAVTSLAPVASNDDENNAGGVITSKLSFSAVAGTTYQIAVDGYGAATGNINLNLASRPANDAFANAQALTGAIATVTGTNVSATKESGEPNHAGNAGGKSVWYKWTPQASGTTTINTTGSNFDTLLAVYRGSAANSLTPLASNDDENNAGGVITSKLSFAATAGTTYKIAVDGYNLNGAGAEAGNITLRLASTDTTAPKVSSTSPANNATGVSRTANVTATFSEAMDEASVEAPGVVTLRKSSGGAAVAATVTYNPTTKMVVLNPNLSLARNTLYTAKVTTGARDLAGNALDQKSTTAGNQAKSWKFTTVP